MPAHRRVLIASASTGTGHLRAGEALKQALAEQEGRWKIEHLDVLGLAPRWVRAAYGGGFELLASRAPWAWGEIYRWADGPQSDTARWGAIAERLLFRSFRRLLHTGSWDLCVCTHFLPAQLTAGRSGLPPFALVITDHTLHRYWVQPRVSRYFVANEELAAGVRGRMSSAQVHATGIPVDAAFGGSFDARAARRALGLDELAPVAVLLGGGLGIGVEDGVRAALRAQVPDLQLVVICGRNTSARQRLAQSGLPANVHLRGYVDQIERFYAAADVVITKPGGLTTSEVLATGRPLLLSRPLPGHEEGNLCTLVATGAALGAATPIELTERLTQVFQSPDQLACMRSAALASARPRAAQSIARTLHEHFLQQVAA